MSRARREFEARKPMRLWGELWKEKERSSYRKEANEEQRVPKWSR
jgi:hypothetical protein